MRRVPLLAWLTALSLTAAPRGAAASAETGSSPPERTSARAPGAPGPRATPPVTGVGASRRPAARPAARPSAASPRPSAASPRPRNPSRTTAPATVDSNPPRPVARRSQPRRSQARRPSRGAPTRSARTSRPPGLLALRSRDGRSSLRVGFAGQLQLEYRNQRDRDGDGERDQRLRPRLRRVRLLLLGSVLSRSLRYYVQLSTAPSSLELVDFWIDWQVCRALHLRLGDQKISFTRYRMGSFTGLALVGWSLVSPAFGDERQIGLLAGSTGKRLPWLVWSAGLFTGINQRAAHAKGMAQTFGEKLANPSDLTDPAPVDAFHPELAARVGYQRGAVPQSTNIDWSGGSARAYAGVGAAWDLDADPLRDYALRLALEGVLHVRHLSLLASGYLGWGRPQGGSRTALAWGQWGLLAQAGYVIARRVSVALRYALVVTDARLRHTARERADALIAASPAEDQAALVAQYDAAGRVREQHELTLGVVVRLLGGSVLWATDVSWLPTRRDDRLWQDALVRTQIQVVF